MSTGRATESLFDQLHGALAEHMLEELKAAREKNLELKPATLSAIIKFLKDNGIDAPATNGNALERLADSLPDVSELDGMTLN